MNIKGKIFLSTSGMVFFALVLSMFSMLYIIDQSIDQQTEILIEDLRVQSCRRIRSGSMILHNYIENYIMMFKNATANLCRDEIISQGIIKGQWKSIFARLENQCKRTGIDFVVVFDTQGRFQVSWPEQIDEDLAESYFRELAMFKNFEKYVDDHDLVDSPVVSSFESWNSKIYRGYDAGIVIVSAGIIPNDYFDEPVGYVLNGVGILRLLPIFVDFYNTTGYVSLLAHGEDPLIWTGFYSEKNNIEKFLHSLGHDRIKNSLSDVSWIKFMDSGEGYHVHSTPLVNFSCPAISVGDTAADTFFVVGEPSSVIFQANEKIKQQAHITRKNILATTLAVSLIILCLTAAVVNSIGEKIAGPITLAASISDKVASGDFSHVMDESNSDETGRLSNSMNIMIRKLKTLRDRNESQLEVLKETNDRNESIFASIQNGVLLIDAERHEIIEVNPAALDMIGARRDEVVGRICHGFVCTAEKGACPVTDKAEVLDNSEAVLLTKEGGRISILKTVAYITLDGRKCLSETFVDITERKHAEERIAESLREKEVLLREIHHRVKNNMQVIISLLRMHSRRTEDAHLGKIFDDCRDRINAMVLIHEALYQSHDLARIDFEVYLKKLCRNLSQAHGASDKGIALKVERCNVALDMDQGIAVGMVICELISNAFKHAFPGSMGGSVSIGLSAHGENIELIVQDDGIGVLPGIDILNPSSLGLKLAVNSVIRELGGTIELDRRCGTRFVVCFRAKHV